MKNHLEKDKAELIASYKNIVKERVENIFNYTNLTLYDVYKEREDYLREEMKHIVSSFGKNSFPKLEVLWYKHTNELFFYAFIVNNQNSKIVSSYNFSPNKLNLSKQDIINKILSRKDGSYIWDNNAPFKDTYILKKINNYIIVAGIYHKDIIKRVKKHIKEICNKLRFDKSGYIWINDDSKPYPKMIMHPIKPELNGRIMDSPDFNTAISEETENAKKINLFVAMLKKCEEKGEGFIQYRWDKPVKDKLIKDMPKISFIKYYKEFHWIFGSGIYIDDINKNIQQKVHQYQTHLNRVLFIILGIFTIFYIIFLFVAIKFFSIVGNILTTFKTFFDEAITKRKKIDTDKIQYTEILELSSLANKMLDDLTISEEKTIQTLKEMQLEKEKWQLYLDISSAIFLILDKKGNISFINKKGAEILDIEREQAIGLNWFKKFLPNETKETVFEVFLQIINDNMESVESYENTVITNSGQIKRIIWHNTKLFDTDNNIIGTISSGIDITLIRKQATLINEAYKKLSDAQRIAHIGNWEFYNHTNSFWASDECFRIFGLNVPKDNLINLQDFMNVLVVEDRKKMKEYLNSLVENKATHYDTTYKAIKHNTNEIRIIRVIADLSHSTNEERKIVGIIQDVTEKEILINTIEEEKNRLNVTLRSIGDGVIVTDVNAKIIMMNSIAEELTEWIEAEAIGKDVSDVFNIINETSEKPLINPVKRAIKDKKAVDLENNTLLISKNGIKRIIADSSSPIFDKNQEIIGVVLVFRDITLKKKMEEEVIKNNKLKSIGILAGGIAHDFNNILTGILGNLSLFELNTDMDKNDPNYEFIKLSQHAALRAKDLTYQLLTFSKGGMPVKKFAAIDDVVIDSTKFILSGSKIKYNFNIETDLFYSAIDKNQISQVVQNIVLNAKDAMPDGGTIDISINNLIVSDSNKNDYPHIEKGKYIKLTLLDNGKGIAKENIKNIFDPYFSTKNNGSGLGLSIVHSIITNHKGYIEVDSKEGEYTKFTIYLPASDTIGQDFSSSIDNNINYKGIKVVVLDDEPDIREIFSKFFKKMLCDVKIFDNGNSLLQYAKKQKENNQRIDVAVLDLTIPGGIGGKDVNKELIKIHPNIKSVICSGYSNDEVISKHTKYGFTAILNKPFDYNDLNKILIEILQSR